MRGLSAVWGKIALVSALLFSWAYIIWCYQDMTQYFARYDTYYRPPARLELPFQPYTKDMPDYQPIPRLLWDDDTYMWLMNLQDMHESGAWRWRWTYRDNYPEGRVVFWSSPYAWWVLSLTKITSWFSHQSFVEILQFVATWANPLLHGILLLTLALILPSYVGAGVTALFLLFVATIPGAILYDFRAFDCDHQSLHDISLQGASLCLVLAGVGWVRQHAEAWQRAKWLFIASGLFGGFGLWIGASRQLVVWTVVGLGIVAAMWARRPTRGAAEQEEVIYQPVLWRYWGWAMAGVCLAGYLIDYFPNRLNLTMLETITPLHALSCWCGGELIYLLSTVRFGQRRLTVAMFGQACLLLGGLVLLPLLLAFGPTEWVTMRDPDMKLMALRIEESQPALGTDWLNGLSQLWITFGLLLLCPFVSLPLLFRRDLPRAWSSATLFSLMPILLILPLYLFYMRSWSYFLNVCLLVHFLVVASLIVQLSMRSPWRKYLWIGASLLVVGQAMLFAKTVIGGLHDLTGGQASAPEIIEGAIERELGLHLASAYPNEKRVYMAATMLGVRLAYFGQGGVMGSQYENIPGISASIQFFSDVAPFDASQKLLVEREVNFVVVNVCQAFLDTTVRLPKSRPPGVENLTLGERLCLPQPIVPDWLEPLPPHPPLFNNYNLKINVYRVKRDRLGLRFSS